MRRDDPSASFIPWATDPIPHKDQPSVIRAAQAGDEAARNRMASSNARFVFETAVKISPVALTNPDLLDELISEGFKGIAVALDRFDADQGCVFISYAVWWIRQAMLEYLGRNANRAVSLPIQGYHYTRKEMQKAKPAQWARAVYNNVSSLNEAVKRHPYNNEVVRDEPINYLPDTAPLPGTAYDDEQRATLAASLLATLPLRQERILRRYYWDEWTLEQIGEAMHLTRERIRQIRNQALQQLRTTHHEMLTALRQEVTL